ncbi:MAG: DUF4922 domain-containing protein [Bacteroidales bacterium]
MNRIIDRDELAPYLKGVTSSSDDIRALLEQQCSSWSLPRANFEALNGVQQKSIKVNGFTFAVQFNPARIQSSSAKVDNKSISERKCFLCLNNLPSEQKGLNFICNDRSYMVLCNPFPIFKQHFTIPDKEHVDQLISSRVGDMLALASKYEDFLFFYNGPKCGASAPDHMHFQAGNKGFLPIEKDFGYYLSNSSATIISKGGVEIDTFYDYPAKNIIFRSTDSSLLELEFERFMQELAILMPQEVEPMVNILCWRDADQLILVVFPRKMHRPSQFYAQGEDNILISPASVDLGGVFITPQEKDFLKISGSDIEDILSQITITEEMFVSLIDSLQEVD